MRAETNATKSIKSASRHRYRLMFTLTCLSIVAATHAAETSVTAWGNTPGLTEPHPDSKGRAGYWWWPLPTMNVDEVAIVSGNQGRVYGPWVKLSEAVDKKEVLPPPAVPNFLGNDPDRLIVIDNIYFEYDSAELNEAGKKEVQRQVERMKRFLEDTVVCFGHTDSIGSLAYNMRLGEARAQAVKAYFISCGIAADRVDVVSKGESKPVVSNDTPENRALNRRVDFEITLGNK